MNAAEKHLLLAVRNAIRTGASLADEECEVEYDEMAPATVGHRYVAVMPGGWTAGARHNSCGGVFDFVYSVDVFAVIRVANVARDRIRNVFVKNLDSLNAIVDAVIDAVDFNYTICTAAQSAINAENGENMAFVTPLRFAAVDAKPRLIPAEVFGDLRGEQKAGLGRVVRFSHCRRITYR